MNSDEAKQILSAWRPHGPDAEDSVFSEALAAAADDPELTRWLGDTKEFDDSMRAALRAESPPDHLRDAILAEIKIANFPSATDGAAATGYAGSVVVPARSAWARPSIWWALAAALVVFIGSTAMLVTGGNGELTAEQFANGALEIAASGQIQLENMEADPSALRSWLASKNSPHDFAIPAGLNGINPLGCQIFEIDGRSVSLMCFKLDDGRIVHYFVIDSDNLEEPPGADPTFLDDRGFVAATWSQGGKTFVLTGSGLDRETLAELV